MARRIYTQSKRGDAAETTRRRIVEATFDLHAEQGIAATTMKQIAARAGVAEAQRKLGLLLAKGGAGLNADPAKAKTWLQQAAAQNDADARKALGAMPK